MRFPRLLGSKVGRHHKPSRTNDIPVKSILLVPETIVPRSTPIVASPDMTEYEMLDDVNLTVEESHASSAHAIAGYVNGKYANWPAIVAKYSKSGKYLLSIDVQANPSVGAQCLDVEKGDATIAQAPAWTLATQAAGKAAKDLRWYPKLYIEESEAQALVAEMTSKNIKRDEYMLWTAHYTDKAHICGPTSCGCPVQADATQWTSSFQGASLDASLCYGYFFAGPEGVVPVTVVKVKVPKVVGLTNTEAVALLERDGLKAGPQASVTGKVVSQTPGPDVEVEKASVVDIHVEGPVSPSKPPVIPTPAPVPPPVIVVPEPSPEPLQDPSGKPGVKVYVQETLDAVIAQKLNLPVGTILFIPHTVEGA